MARDPEALNAELQRLLRPDARGRLRALGLARSMIWRNWAIPEGGPNFPAELTQNLLDFGYGVLALVLELRDVNRELPSDGQRYETTAGFLVAAECIEA